jgi:hypothetical protein
MEEDMNVVSMELKYCERCGALWFRVRASGDIYCGACAAQLAARHRLTLSRGRPRIPLSDKIDLRGEFATFPMLYGDGGQA